MEVTPLEEAFDTVTEQDAVWLETRLVGVHVREVIFTGACSVRLACADVPLREAVMVAL
jgi:hypothetical protein